MNCNCSVDHSKYASGRWPCTYYEMVLRSAIYSCQAKEIDWSWMFKYAVLLAFVQKKWTGLNCLWTRYHRASQEWTWPPHNTPHTAAAAAKIMTGESSRCYSIEIAHWLGNWSILHSYCTYTYVIFLQPTLYYIITVIFCAKCPFRTTHLVGRKFYAKMEVMVRVAMRVLTDLGNFPECWAYKSVCIFLSDRLNGPMSITFVN